MPSQQTPAKTRVKMVPSRERPQVGTHTRRLHRAEAEEEKEEEEEELKSVDVAPGAAAPDAAAPDAAVADKYNIT